jgi:3-dehydroquinate dehydratase
MSISARQGGGIAGFGIVGYDLALRGLKAILTK